MPRLNKKLVAEREEFALEELKKGLNPTAVNVQMRLKYNGVAMSLNRLYELMKELKAAGLKFGLALEQAYQRGLKAEVEAAAKSEDLIEHHEAMDYMEVHQGDDFLDEIVAERTEKNPEFPALVEAAVQVRESMKESIAKNRPEEQLSSEAKKAREPLSPAILVDALQDVIRVESGISRPAVSTKVKKGPEVDVDDPKIIKQREDFKKSGGRGILDLE